MHLVCAWLLVAGPLSSEAVWKKFASGVQPKDSRVSRHRYFAPLTLRTNHMSARKVRHSHLMKKHKQLLNTTGEALLAVSGDSRRDARQILLENHGSEFTGPVQVGSPGQEQQCIFDTGSSMAWIMSTKCTSEICQMHHRFDSTKSDTFSSLHDAMNVQFGTGSLSGTLAKDTISLGGVNLGEVVLGEITSTKGSVFRLDFDGICGLSYKMSDEHLCFLDSISKSDQLEEKSFTFYFGENESALIFGEPEPSIRGSNVQWYPVSRKFYWETTLKDVTVNNVSVKHPKKEATLVFDTGTSVLTMPTASATSTVRLLKRAGLDCDLIKRGEAPEVCYHFDDADSICLKEWYEKGEEGCTASLMTLDLMEENIFILGQPFFSAYVTTFDVGNNRIGVARSTA